MLSQGGGPAPPSSASPSFSNPSSLPTKSYARVLADAALFALVSIAVHQPAFTDLGEPAVFFSAEEIAATLKPFQFAIVAKTPYGSPPFQEIKQQLQQRLNLGHDFIITALDNRHLLIRCSSEDDYLCLLMREQLLVKGFLFKFLKWTIDFKCGKEPPIAPVALRTSQLTNATAAYACVELDLLKDKPSKIWIGLGSTAQSFLAVGGRGAAVAVVVEIAERFHILRHLL
ncbi:hypothetical protein Taro_022166 [Colocasia esculenta]|uniref:DUF4283 domain-containing protein n=1 Tax=Colocasia esculenta TaxID=4460 RepID=A0A843V4L2_COLES|nr:hypothetical protein [Colocasia esculenta]